jgi:hypothetical protein
MPSWVVATPVTRTLQIIVARYGRWHWRHDNCTRQPVVPRRRNDPGAAFCTSQFFPRKRRFPLLGSLDQAQEPPGLVICSLASIGSVEEEEEGVHRFLVASLRGAVVVRGMTWLHRVCSPVLCGASRSRTRPLGCRSWLVCWWALHDTPGRGRIDTAGHVSGLGVV